MTKIIDDNEYYLLSYILNTENNFLIWISNNIDGLITDNSKILSFTSSQKAHEYAVKNNIKIKESELIIYDIDEIKNFIFFNKKVDDKYNTILNLWNLYMDVFSSLYGYEQRQRFEKDICEKYYKNSKKAKKYISKIYDKVFWANNLDIVTPIEKYYEPIWRKSELKMLRRILKEGLRIFETNLVTCQ